MSVFEQVAFVRAVEQEKVVVSQPQPTHTAVRPLNGDSARRFYDDVVSQPSTSVDGVKQLTAAVAGRNRRRRTCSQSVKPVKVSEYFSAAQRNDISALERCLSSGVDVDVTDIFGWTALMCASCDGATASVQYLLENGASRCLTNTQGKTAVELAAQRGHVVVVELLCKPEKLAKAKAAPCTEARDPQQDPAQLCHVCDRYLSSSERNAHETSIVHQFNLRRDSAPGMTHYGIAESNAGFRMLLGMGWNRERGFGLREQGRKFPVKTVLKRNRSGLGAEAPTPRVTHFAAHDRAAVESREGTPLKRKEQESRSRRMKHMEIEFRRSFH